MNLFASVPPPFTSWGGWIIFGMLLLTLASMWGVIAVVWRFRLDGRAFLRGAESLLQWAKDARNTAEHRATTAVAGAVREMKQEAARVVEAAEAVKAVAGAAPPTPQTPAKEPQ